ncbi:MAG TPA: UDP-N-acetylmuramoyl-L-alanine--D-glutamate ligase [Gemmatimonadaceae bacterium]|nr:UDP-N-acetylmuramoyl-L-alanine--D-glutamate ligase [Gemmatimonadaceae bacterium]
MTPPVDLPARDRGEIAVVGLARSGRAVAKLLRKHGYEIYGSDAATTPEVAASADELKSIGITAQLGGHDFARLARSALVVVSPGVPPDAAPLALAREKGIPVVSEVGVALNFLRESRIVAVTGTNGKTTTTALIAHILKHLTGDAVEAGNIGTALSEVALSARAPRWIALEMSSFQLHDTPGLKPLVGVLTNLSPDHLDRYAGVEEYYADKARLFAAADGHSRSVVNGDDERVLEMVERVPGQRHEFSLRKEAAAFYDERRDQLALLGEPLMPRSRFRLLGRHNVANALAASLAVAVADDSHRTPEARLSIAAALETFRALPHRLELVGEFSGVQWINDSKATNVSSTAVAIDGMERPTVLLLGGRHKGEPYAALLDVMQRKVKKVIAYGEAAPLIERDLSRGIAVEVRGADFEEVVGAARSAASPGDAILLSPACSSYDMFANYEERGDRFRSLASAVA